jgi:hypothetical protein
MKKIYFFSAKYQPFYQKIIIILKIISESFSWKRQKKSLDTSGKKVFYTNDTTKILGLIFSLRCENQLPLSGEMYHIFPTQEKNPNHIHRKKGISKKICYKKRTVPTEPSKGTKRPTTRLRRRVLETADRETVRTIVVVLRVKVRGEHAQVICVSTIRRRCPIARVRTLKR